eukprot:3042014-Prymnesium_polylepis.1
MRAEPEIRRVCASEKAPHQMEFTVQYTLHSSRSLSRPPVGCAGCECSHLTYIRRPSASRSPTRQSTPRERRSALDPATAPRTRRHARVGCSAHHGREFTVALSGGAQRPAI